MFADHIRDLRKQAGLSQEQMAERLGVSRQAVTRWETGLGTPDLDNIVAIADLFGVTVDSLLRDSPEQAVIDDEPEVPNSITQCDVFAAHDFDISFGNARNVKLIGTQTSKVRVVLESASIEGLQEAFKVHIDPDENSFDIEVVSMGSVTAAEARSSLDVRIEVPANWENRIELEGSADSVEVSTLAASRVEVGGKFARLTLSDVIGHVEADTNQDLFVHCVTLPSRLDINQLSSTSRLQIPRGEAIALRKRGIANHLVLDGVEETANAEHLIELNGMRSELTIATEG
jgi:transcriptional regulator with XRE-family HTH domain